MRAALYARFSTELQQDRSVDDQLALCRAYAEANGYEIAGTYADYARTGDTMHGRAGLQRLVQDARAARFDAIVVEALDRLSRDQEDLAGLHKRFTFLGVAIYAVHDGLADAIQVGIRGLVSSLFLTDLKHKIRRGMAGVLRDGRHPGGRAYGYRPTPGQPGVLRIHEPEAQIVRRIFIDYISGSSPRDIAGTLNAEGIPAPRSSRWNASTINGNGQRGSGILHNRLYAGRIVWNRLRMVRDPDTGRRISRPNPESEWQQVEAPELAIVEPETWEAAQARKIGRGTAGRPHRKRKRILSGLLRCGCCGRGMSQHDLRQGVVRIRCSTARESGSCGNARRYRLDRIEEAVIEGMRRRLEDADGIAAFLEAHQAERRAEAGARASLERKAAATRGRIDRLSRLLLYEQVTEEFFSREMPALRAELASLEARLSAAPATQIVTLHPASIEAYRRAMRDLTTILRTLDPERPADRDLMEAFRALIDHVVIHDREDGGVEAEVVGCLAPLIGPEADRWGGSVVAEEGFEPPTQGL